MENVQHNHISGPGDFEATDTEVEQVSQLAAEKFDAVVPKAEAVKLVKLIKELDWWQKVSRKDDSTRQITVAQMTELQELINQVSDKPVTQDEARESAKAIITFVPYKEKQRILDEIRGILVEHRRISDDPAVTEKLARLLELHYGVALTGDQLKQVVQFLARKLWHEEGLDSTLNQCLDDILVYIDKRRRDKRTTGLNLHNEIRKALDLTVSKLAGTNFDALYRKQD